MIKDVCVTKYSSLKNQSVLTAFRQSVVEHKSRVSWLHFLSISLIISLNLNQHSSFLNPSILSAQMLRSLFMLEKSCLLCLYSEIW